MKLLLEIQSGYFNPDCSRAGRFNKQCMPDPSSDVGAQSFNDSDGENFFMEETIDKKLSDAVEVVETQTAEIDEDHYTSSSSDSEAESVVLEAPVRVFLPPRAPEGSTGGQKPCTWWMPNFLVELAVVDCWTRTLSCPHN